MTDATGKQELSLSTIELMLQQTKRIVEHQRDMEKLRGEAFNIFSILTLTTDENRHSKFIAELLKPDGSHFKGDTFLKLFMEVLPKPKNSEGKEVDLKLNTEKTKVTTEKYVGNKDLDTSTGGRIDLFLTDGKQHISIENKIDAADQAKQLLRYYNFKKENNNVYYLTKLGGRPEKQSCESLEEGKDFICISYKTHIIEWLELCLKESVSEPILRESIRQYLLIIKKITNTLEKSMDQKLKDLIIKNRGAAKIINDNYGKVINGVRDDLRKALRSSLEKKFEENKLSLAITTKHKVDKQFSSLWIWGSHKKHCFGIEPFSGRGHWDGNLFVGYFNEAEVLTNKEYPNMEITENKFWPIVRFVEYGDEKLNMYHTSSIKLFADKDSEAFRKVIEACTKQIVQFIQETNKTLLPKHKVY